MEAVKTFSVYIDFVGEDSSIEFANKLKGRLIAIDHKLDVTLYSDLERNLESWEEHVLMAIEKASIVISILSPSYLDFMSKLIEKKFESIIESNDQHLFPIYFEASSWGSFDWIVNSHLIPSDDIPLIDYSDKDRDDLINDLLETIGGLVIKE